MCGLQTVPMTKSNEKEMEVAEMTTENAEVDEWSGKAE